MTFTEANNIIRTSTDPEKRKEAERAFGCILRYPPCIRCMRSRECREKHAHMSECNFFKSYADSRPGDPYDEEDE